MLDCGNNPIGYRFIKRRLGKPADHPTDAEEDETPGYTLPQVIKVLDQGCPKLFGVILMRVSFASAAF
jgi:hypothetical protein